MKISLYKTSAAIVLALHGLIALAELSPAQIASNINDLTAKSQALQVPANSITCLNGPLIVIGQGPFPVRTTSVSKRSKR